MKLILLVMTILLMGCVTGNYKEIYTPVQYEKIPEKMDVYFALLMSSGELKRKNDEGEYIDAEYYTNQLLLLLRPELSSVKENEDYARKLD